MFQLEQGGNGNQKIIGTADTDTATDKTFTWQWYFPKNYFKYCQRFENCIL